MKRTLALIFAALLLASATACGSSGDTGKETVATQTAETTAQEEVKDPIGHLNGAYNGATFTTLARQETSYEVLAEELTGEAVNDAVYEREHTVEDKFGVKIETKTEPGTWSARDTFCSVVSNAVLAGTSAYDMVCSHMGYMVNMSVQGLGYNLLDLPNTDFSADWWCEQYFNDCVVDGKVFCGVGDIVISTYANMEVVFFNKTLVKDFNIGDVYGMVNDGTWTMDKLLTLADTAYKDLNGDGAMTEDADLFTIGLNAHANRIMQVSLDMNISKRDKDGKILFNLANNEKYLNAYAKLYDLCCNRKGGYLLKDDSDGEATMPMFVGDRMVFWATRIGLANGLREMNSEYGIVPFPKYDEKQENYRTGFCDNLSVVFVPKTIENPDMVGNVMEAMCILGQETVVPNYYEVTLKSKYFSDPTAAEMLDLIRSCASFDVMMVYNMPLSYPYSNISGWIKSGTESITSAIAEKQSTYEANLKQMYEGIASAWVK